MNDDTEDLSNNAANCFNISQYYGNFNQINA